MLLAKSLKRKAFCFLNGLKELFRRYPLSDIWKRVFNAFLNIPDCENLPDWFAVVKDVREALEEYVDDDPRSWQASLNQCNEMLRSLN